MVPVFIVVRYLPNETLYWAYDCWTMNKEDAVTFERKAWAEALREYLREALMISGAIGVLEYGIKSLK